MPTQDPYNEDDEDRAKGRGPSPTSYVNFQRYFGSNQGAARAGAAKLGSNASTAASGASDALKTSQDQFNKGVSEGSVPAAPTTNVGAGATTPTTNTGTGSQPAPGSNPSALTGESTRPGAGMTAAEMQANADKTYTGPSGLADTAGYQAAQDQATAAQGQLDALGSPGGIQALIQQNNPYSTNSAFSSSLEGTAGRADFDKLRAQFNPEKDFTAAQDAAGKTGAQAALDSAKNADEWATMAGIQGDAETKQAAYEQAKADAKTQRDADAAKEADAQVPEKGYEQTYAQDTPENRHEYMMSGVNQNDPAAVANREKQIAQYEAAMTMTAQNQLDQTFNDINTVMSPINWVTDEAGIADPTQRAAQQEFGGLSLDAGNQKEVNARSGSTSQMHIPWNKVGASGFFVFTHMTPDDWQTLNSKPQNGPNGQIAWINTRAAQMREGQAEHNSTPKGPQQSQS